MDVLALFLAASAYVTPLYYPSRLKNSGVVPTWNYVAAEVRGRLTLHDDPQWKLNQVRALTHHFEERRDPSGLLTTSMKSIEIVDLKELSALRLPSLASRVRRSCPRIDRRKIYEAFATTLLRDRSRNATSLNE